jgi:heat shock protein HslJ
MSLTRITTNGLENRDWSIAQYSDGTPLVAAGDTARVSFMNGRLDGSPGCGALFGMYRPSGTRLTSRVSVILGGYCPDDVMRQSNAVVDALAGERFVEPQGDGIALRDERGTIRIILKP